MRLEGRTPARASGAIGALCLAALLCAPAEAKPPAPAGKVASVSAAPASASHGEVVAVQVRLENRRDVRSDARTLLIKLRAPDGSYGLLLEREEISPIRPRASRTADIPVTIPADAPSGDATLIACRAKQTAPDSCGISRQSAELRVLTPARFTISPGAHTFESRATGTSSPSRTFTVTNQGETASQPIATSITGADASQFTKSDDGCEGRALAAGESCELNAAFTPTTTGNKSAGLRASTAESSATAALTGTGVPPAKPAISP